MDERPKDGIEALQWLLDGNARFVAGTPRHEHQSGERRAELVGGQQPWGIVLGCADSRVPPELIFDFGLGDLFVIRVAGNVVSDEEAGSIEYAVKHLGVRLVMVLGHEACGAVTAALGPTEGEIEELVRLLDRIRPAVADIDPALPEEERVRLGVEANVMQSLQRLREIAAREGEAIGGETLFVGAIYDLETGKVRLLER
jgi:carbonic anhydrase